MADPVDVAIEAALLERATTWAAAQVPAIAIALPGIAFTPPEAVVGVTYGRWLRSTFLPAPSFETGISFDAHLQHYGLFQIDVFYGQGGGELAPGRIASALLAHFKRGTRVMKDGFNIRVIRAPYRGSMIKDTPWSMIAVTIPYMCFARPA